MATAGSLNEQDAIDLLLTYVFDLLAQTEAQQRSITRTRVRLQSYAVHVKHAGFRGSERRECFEVVAGTVRELSEAIANQGRLVADMSRMVKALQGKRT